VTFLVPLCGGKGETGQVAMMGDRAATGCGRGDEDEMQRIAQLMEQLAENLLFGAIIGLPNNYIVSTSGPSNNLSN
jgi:hypothetical protein